VQGLLQGERERQGGVHAPAIVIKGAASIEAQIKVLEKWLPQIFLIADARAKLLVGNVEAMITVAGNLDASLEVTARRSSASSRLSPRSSRRAVNITASAEAAASVTGSLTTGG